MKNYNEKERQLLNDLEKVKKLEQRVINRLGWIASINAKRLTKLKAGDTVRLKIFDDYSVGEWLVAGFNRGQIAFVREENFMDSQKCRFRYFRNYYCYEWPHAPSARRDAKRYEKVPVPQQKGGK